MAKTRPSCQLCGQTMKARKKSSGNVVGLALALIVLTVGVVLTLTGIGAIVGIPLIILSLFMGGKRYKVWQCPSCSWVAQRA